MVTWKGKRRPEIANMYWRWCKTEKRPYVQITSWRGRANIMMDCPCLPGRTDDEAKREIESLLKQNECPGSPRWETIDIVYDEVPLPIATKLAVGFYDIAVRFGQRKGVNP